MTTQQILQGVHDWTNGKIVYDISVAHPDGQGNPTPYVDLASALGTGGGNIPEGLRKGGMSVKFIQGTAQSSDNKYVQFRYMLQYENTTSGNNAFKNTANWQGVDEEPTAGSKNLVESGGTYLLNQRINTNLIKIDKLDYPSKEYLFRSNNTTLVPCALEAGEYIFKNNSAIILVVALVDAEENTIVIIGSRNGIPSGSSVSFTLPSDSVYLKVWIGSSAGTTISIGFTISADGNLNKRLTEVEGVVGENVDAIIELQNFEEEANPAIHAFNGTVSIDETELYSAEELTIDASGFSEAIDISTSPYLGCRIVFDTPVYHAGSYCQLSLFEYDENNNVINSVVADAYADGGIMFTKKGENIPYSTEVTQVNFPDGGYYDFIPKQQTKYIKIRAFINRNNQVLADRVPEDWTFYKTNIIGIIRKASVIESGLTVEDLMRTPPAITFEQGSIAFSTGQPVSSSNYIRSVGYNKVDDYKYIRGEYGKEYHVFYYDASYNFISQGFSSRANFIQKIEYPNAVYFRVSISSTGITPTSNFYFDVSGRNEAFEDVYKEGINIMVNMFMDDTRFRFFNTTDMHGVYKDLDVEYILKNLFGGNILSLCTGDMLQLTPKTNNVLDPNIQVYMEKAVSMGIHHCVGQHEVGFQNIGAGVDGKAKSRCFTHEEVFDTFIEPMLDVYGLPSNHNTIWWSKTIAAYKVVLISLYQFNVPLVDDPNDNTKYKYIRCSLWYGQDQINWLVNTLNNVPSGYKVIIMYHEAEANMIMDVDNPFYGPKAGGANAIMDDCVVRDIVDAYISKTTLTKTYTGQYSFDPSHDDTDYSDLTLSVNADFSNAVGSFAFYLCGDCHADSFGKLKDAANTQRIFCLGSASIPSDKIITGINGIDTFVTGFAVDKHFSKVYVGRCGHTDSWFLQRRDKTVINLTEVS